MNAQLHVLGQLIQRSLGLLMLPAGQHVIGFTHRLVIFGQMRCRFLLIPNIKSLLSLRFQLFHAAQADALWVENNACSRHDRGIVRQLSCGIKVFINGCRAHEKHVTRVRETFTTTTIGLKLLRQAVTLTGEVTNRVIIFRIGQTAHRHRPWIA